MVAFFLVFDEVSQRGVLVVKLDLGIELTHSVSPSNLIFGLMLVAPSILEITPFGGLAKSVDSVSRLFNSAILLLARLKVVEVLVEWLMVGHPSF